MKDSMLILLMACGLVVIGNGCVVVPVPGPPPPPMVEVYGPAPFPGAVWVTGDWRWHGGHQHWQWYGGHWRR